MTDKSAETPLTLEDRLEALLKSTEGIRAGIERENRRRDKKIKTNMFAIAFALVVGVVGITVGGIGIKTAVDANHERDGARIASCIQYNLQQKAQAAAEIAESRDFVAALVEDAGNSPAAVASGKAFDRSHDSLIGDAHASRDCTPAGIARYLHAAG